MKWKIGELVRACAVCQRHKVETLQPAGLLQPLSIDAEFPNRFGLTYRLILWKDYLLLMARMLYWCSWIGSPNTAISYPLHTLIQLSIARLFFDNIFKLHGLPMTMVNDRDMTFKSAFGGNSSILVILNYVLVLPIMHSSMGKLRWLKITGL